MLHKLKNLIIHLFQAIPDISIWKKNVCSKWGYFNLLLCTVILYLYWTLAMTITFHTFIETQRSACDSFKGIVITLIKITLVKFISG